MQRDRAKAKANEGIIPVVIRVSVGTVFGALTGLSFAMMVVSFFDPWISSLAVAMAAGAFVQSFAASIVWLWMQRSVMVMEEDGE